jgi:SAM-dependent methyltransferase
MRRLRDPIERRVLDDQVAYYRARAGEYDQWFLREGRYDRGPEHRARWFAQIREVEAALEAERPFGEVLEMACGTGLWTRRLVTHATRVVAVDAAPEALASNRARIGDGRIDYVCADLFEWQTRHRFDLAMFGFWLSHVPESLFDSFWSGVRESLTGRGKAFFVDSLFEPASTATDHAPIDRSGTVRRRLNDGREFEIVKIFHDPSDLAARLRRLGWSGYVRSTDDFFIYGCVTPHPIPDRGSDQEETTIEP